MPHFALLLPALVQASVETVLANFYENRPLPTSNSSSDQQHLQRSTASIKGAFNAALVVLSQRESHMHALKTAASQGRCPPQNFAAAAELVSNQAVLDLLGETRTAALEYIGELLQEATALRLDNNALRNTLVTERVAHAAEVERLEVQLEQQRLAGGGIPAQLPAELF